MVFDNSTTSFWFYDGSTWIEIVAGALGSSTLDEAYDEGGAGAGRVITADGGVVSVQGSDGIEVTGTFGSGATIGSPGGGSRMFFNPRKAAFRAGYAFGTNWNDANVGVYSVALGADVLASGSNSVSIGTGNTASGTVALAVGSNLEATSTGSVALGNSCISDDQYSVVLGYGSSSRAPYSTAIGANADANGSYSVALGGETTSGAAYGLAGPGATVEDTYGFAVGNNAISSENDAVALGFGTTASASASFAAGYNATASGLRSFASGGNGVSSGEYSITMGQQNTASGNNSISMGIDNNASSVYAIAMGFDSEASGFSAVAIGNDNTASGARSAAFNYGSTASEAFSFAGGNSCIAAGIAAFAIGSFTESNGRYSASLNERTIAQARNSTAIGRYNVGAGNSNSWITTDPLFEIGNGNSSINRSNAFTVLKNGNTGIMNATPDATLDVVGTFQLVDGSQAAGLVLTSDANGNATWATPTIEGNTLDAAYDEGGPGAGRTIQADNGAVTINKNSSATGPALDISVNSGYNLNARSAMITTNALTGMETYININGSPGPPYGRAFLITNEASSNINGLDGIAIEYNQASSLNYGGDNRGFLYDVTYNGGTAATLFGYQAHIEGLGTAEKYGAHITIPSSSGGAQYGVYSDVQKASGYAAYFLGRTSLGTGTTNRYLMPATDGNAGEVMTTDGAGNVDWEGPVGFSTYLNSGTAIISGADFEVTTTEFTSNCTFNTANSTFTVPRDGIYSFTVTDFSSAAVSSLQGIRVNVGATAVKQLTWLVQNASMETHSFTFLLELSAGDVVIFNATGNRTLSGSASATGARCSIEGHLVR